MSGASYTHRDLAKAVGVTVTTIKSYRRKFPGFLPVESQGKPLRLAAEALAVCKRIHHHFHRGLSVLETRKRLDAEFPALAQAALPPRAPASAGPGRPGFAQEAGAEDGIGHNQEHSMSHGPSYVSSHDTRTGQLERAEEAFLPGRHGPGDTEPLPGTTRQAAAGPLPGAMGQAAAEHMPGAMGQAAAGLHAAAAQGVFPRQPEPLARIEALMGDLFSLQNRTHSLMAELVSKLDTLTGQLAASLPGARGQHREGLSTAPGQPWSAPSGAGGTASQPVAAPQPGSGVSAGRAASAAQTFGHAPAQSDALSSGRHVSGSPASSDRPGPSPTRATAGNASPGAAEASVRVASQGAAGASVRVASQGAATREAGRPEIPAGQPVAHGTVAAGTLAPDFSPSAAPPDPKDASSTPPQSAARPGADFLGLTVVVQSERGEYLGVTGKNGRPFDLGQFEGYLLRRAQGLGSFKAVWHRVGPEWVLELLGQGQVHAHHFHKATTPKGNTVALFASLTVGGKAVSETSLQSFLRQVKESLGD